MERGTAENGSAGGEAPTRSVDQSMSANNSAGITGTTDDPTCEGCMTRLAAHEIEVGWCEDCAFECYVGSDR